MPRIRGPEAPRPAAEAAKLEKQDDEVIDNGKVARPLGRGAKGRILKKEAIDNHMPLPDSAGPCADTKFSKSALLKEAAAAAPPVVRDAPSPKERLGCSLFSKISKPKKTTPIDLSTPEKVPTAACDASVGLLQRRRGRPQKTVHGAQCLLKAPEPSTATKAQCPGGHAMKAIHGNEGVCDVCDAEFGESVSVMGCPTCNWAACMTCYDGPKAVPLLEPAQLPAFDVAQPKSLPTKRRRVSGAAGERSVEDSCPVQKPEKQEKPDKQEKPEKQEKKGKQDKPNKRTDTASFKKVKTEKENEGEAAKLVAPASTVHPDPPLRRPLTSRFRLRTKMSVLPDASKAEQLAVDSPKPQKRKLILTEKGRPLSKKAQAECPQVAPGNKLFEMLKRNKRTEAAKLLDMLKRRAATTCLKPRSQLKCLLGHALEKQVISDGAVHTCAECDLQLDAGANSWTCRPCDHDICESCKTKADGSSNGGVNENHNRGNAFSTKRTIVMPIDTIAFLKQVRARMRSNPPRRGGSGDALALASAQRRRQHEDASMLGVFRERLLAGEDLSEPVQRALRQSPELSAQLEAWQAEAQETREAEALAAVHEEEPEDAGAEGAEGDEGAEGAGDEDGAAEGAAHRALLDAIAERHPRVRPKQCLDRLRQMRAAGQTDGDEYVHALQEHRDAMVIAYLQRSFMAGTLGEGRCATQRALHRLPEAWSLSMMLAWQRQLLAKMERIAEAHPKELPSSVNDTRIKDEHQREVGRKSCAEWIKEFRVRAQGKVGLDPHVSEEFRRWFPWADAALEEWGAISAMKASKTKCIQSTPQELALDRLKALTSAYPDHPPKRHIYTTSEEEENERKDAWALVRLEKVFFVGALKAETMQELCEQSEWLRNAAKEWEANRAAGLDPDDAAIVQRLREIAQRCPKKPPSQKCCMANATPEMRLSYSDTAYFRRIKERFLDKGLPQSVSEAIAAIPIWGAPRLREWEEQKQQRSQALWAKRTPTAKPACEDGPAEDGPTDAAPLGIKRMRVESTAAVAPGSISLSDSDVLVVSGAEPKFHKIRLRAAACHGKTVAEALASVFDGLMPLTRNRILGDIRSGVLKVEGSSQECSGGESADAAGEPLKTPPPKQSGRSAAAGKSSSKRKHGEEVFRKLDGTIGTLTAFKAEVKERMPLTKLTLGEIDRMSTDDLAHYEKQLGFSARRSLQERVSIVEALNQKSKIQAFAKKSAGAEDQDCPTAKAPAAKQFHELSDYERSMLSQSELEYFESRAALGDVGLFSVEDRRRRLKEQHHSQSQQDLNKGGATGRLDAFFKTAGVPKKLVLDSLEVARESGGAVSSEAAPTTSPEQPSSTTDVEPAMDGVAEESSNVAPLQADGSPPVECPPVEEPDATMRDAKMKDVPTDDMTLDSTPEPVPDATQEPTNNLPVECPLVEEPYATMRDAKMEDVPIDDMTLDSEPVPDATQEPPNDLLVECPLVEEPNATMRDATIEDVPNDEMKLDSTPESAPDAKQEPTNDMLVDCPPVEGRPNDNETEDKDPSNSAD